MAKTVASIKVRWTEPGHKGDTYEVDGRDMQRELAAIRRYIDSGVIQDATITIKVSR